MIQTKTIAMLLMIAIATIGAIGTTGLLAQHVLATTLNYHCPPFTITAPLVQLTSDSHGQGQGEQLHFHQGK